MATKSIAEIKDIIEQGRVAYQEMANTASAPELREASNTVVAWQKELVKLITAGANPCPNCGGPPTGLEQPRPRGDGVEYEIGCPACGWFRHSDNTARDHGARGGLLPSHAVDAWNAGPDHWKKKFVSPEELAKLPTSKAGVAKTASAEPTKASAKKASS